MLTYIPIHISNAALLTSFLSCGISRCLAWFLRVVLITAVMYRHLVPPATAAGLFSHVFAAELGGGGIDKQTISREHQDYCGIGALYVQCINA